MVPPQAITRGYARHARDEARLRAMGVKTIYRADKGERLGRFKMRRGELLGVVDGFLAFGDARRDWIKAEELVHSWGAVIIDAETGMRSDQQGAKMLDYALRPRRPSDEYRAMQEASVAKRVKGRIKTRAAEKIWLNKKLSIKEKIDLTGIPMTTLYRMFGKTNVPAGRRKK